MQLNKPTLLLLVLGLSASCVLAKSEPHLLENLWDRLGKAAQGFIDHVKNSTGNGDGVDLQGGFIAELNNATSQLAKEAAELGLQIAEALHDAATEALTNYRAIVKAEYQRLSAAIGRVRDRKIRLALSNAAKALNAISEAASQLREQWDSIDQKLDEEKQKHIRNIKDQFLSWADEQLKRVDEATNGAGKEQALAIITEFQNKFIELFQNSVEEFNARQSLFDLKVQEFLTGLSNLTNGLSAEIESCLRANSDSQKCSAGIAAALESLQDAPYNLHDLKVEALEILEEGLKASARVAETLIEFELEKAKIVLQLDQLLARCQCTCAEPSE